MLEHDLYRLFGFRSFKAGQKEIIQTLLDQNDVFAMLPTGRGKSLCYQLPALLTEGLTIVISPLLSLMEDQVQQLKRQGIKQVASMNSFSTWDERRELLDQLHMYKILYTSPEMLQSKELLNRLIPIRIAYLVVDEAHCVSYWGHDFRADYLRIKNVKELLSNPPCLAITATASAFVREDVMTQLALTKPVSFIESVNRSNISLFVEEVSIAKQKVERLCEVLEKAKVPGLIYVQTRAHAESLFLQLRERIPMLKSSYYHGGMPSEERMLIQQQFIEGQLDVVIATSAFGMGLNKSDIRFVVHLHYPLDMASYVQEIGRAGRDNEQSIALVLISPEDYAYAQFFVQRNERSEEEWIAVMNELSKQAVDEQTIVKRLEELQIEQARTFLYLMELWGIKWNTLREEAMIKNLATKLYRYFKDRQEEKLERLKPVVTYINQAESCRRATMLRFLDEEPVIQGQCCDRCGLTLNAFQRDEDAKHDKRFEWQEELNILFGLTENELPNE
ncbi:LOW QUALITY PROTEIN: ATP-dependent DNA helicase RecQ [Bacillus sp. JCM 19045]|nr:LOW QUALITY PROTEIN: ATP-dependent DNA helicase RecQ [Bacillus sp. JCM 19045]